MSKKALLFIFLGFLIVIAGCIYFVHYKKAHAGIALLCGDLSISMSKEFMNLSKPDDIPQLDQYGCYANTDGCACAKKDSKGQGIIFGISSTNDLGVAIPTETADQKTFLKSLGELLIANAKASTTITAEEGTFKKIPSLTITSVLHDGNTEPTARDFFFIRNGKLYDSTLQTNSADFTVWWPNIASSLTTLGLVK